MTDHAIQEIWRFPIKTLGGERLGAAEVTPFGLPYDRHWALYEADTGTRLRSFRTEGALDLNARLLEDAAHPIAEVAFPDGRVLTTDDARLDKALSDHFRRPITLRQTEADQTTFHYDGKITVITAASLRFLQKEAPGALLSNRRFRANIVLASDSNETDWVERRWVGRPLNIGTAELMVTSNVERCVVTTRAQAAFGHDPALPRDPTVMQALIRLTGNHIAVHCEVQNTGRIRLGDRACPA